MKKVIFIYLGLVVVVIGLALTRIVNFGNFFGGSGQNQQGEGQEENAEAPRAKVTVGSKEFEVTVANSDAARQIGLSETESLDENEGMLFLFDQKGMHSFWMRNMSFPIDILFIDFPIEEDGTLGDQGVVADIESNVPLPPENVPLTEIPTYAPEGEVNVVLEINAGSAEANNISVGDTVQIDLE